MRKIIAYFIKYPVLGNTLMIAMLVFGVLGYLNLKKTFFPERESRMIRIQLLYPGASPQEIEEGIVQRIEDNLKGLTGIERVSSISSENTGEITVEVLKTHKTDKVLQDVKNAVDRISSFPAGMEPPVIFEVEKLSFAISFAISGDVGLKTLKDHAQKIEDDLMAMNGISKVAINGYPDEEIEIGFRENDLRKYGLTFQEVSDAVRKSNLELTGGTVKGHNEEFLVRGRAKNYYAADLQNIIIRSSAEGRTIRLRDVAEVTDRWADSPDRSYYNAEPSVVITINNTLEEDVLQVTDQVKAYVEKFNEENDLVHATIIRDQSVYLKQRLDLLADNGLVGFLLVILFLSMFLNYRLAFWVALSIPIAFAGMFIMGATYDLTINVISLFGMILVVGILVDDGIVVSENIYQHYERGKPAIRAAIDGTMEVLPSVFSAIMTTVVGFSIFFFLDGFIGEIITDMAFVVIATLLISLVEAVLILPAHIAHSAALKGRAKKSRLEQFTTGIMDLIKDRLYAPTLTFVIRNKFFTFALGLGLLMVTVGAMSGGVIKSTFFPNIERDNITISLQMPAGSRDHITEKWLDHIEKAAWEVNAELRTNRSDNEDVVLAIEKKIGPSTYQGSLNVILLDGEARGIQDFEVANLIRMKAGPVPGAEKLSYGMDSPWGKAVSVSLLGHNKAELSAARDDLKAAFQQMDELKDVVDNDKVGLKEIDIRLKDKAYQLGFQLQDVVGQVRQGFFGTEVQRLQRNKDEVRIWVRYKEDDRRSIQDLEEMRIRSVNGGEYPLKELADFSIARGITAINHLDGRPEIRVEADVSDPTGSVKDVVDNIRSYIVPEVLARYPGVTALYEGQSRESDKTANSAKKALPIVLLLMFLIVVITFRSFLQATIVFLLLPLGLVGVGWGHFLHDMSLSVLSVYGIIALIGVIINDSLVFISTMNGNLREGMKYEEAVYQAGVSRFRPIVLTSLTTIAGLGPLILNNSIQAQFLIPMAISISYGLLYGTLLMLLMLPVMLLFFNDMRVYLNWFWEGKRPTREQVEPAVKELEVHE